MSNKAITILGVAAALITVFVFLTGIPSVPSLNETIAERRARGRIQVQIDSALVVRDSLVSVRDTVGTSVLKDYGLTCATLVSDQEARRAAVDNAADQSSRSPLPMVGLALYFVTCPVILDLIEERISEADSTIAVLQQQLGAA